MCVCVKVDSAVCVCVEGLALWFASLMWFGYEKSNGSPTVPRQTHTHTLTHTPQSSPTRGTFPRKHRLASHSFVCVCGIVFSILSHTGLYIYIYMHRFGRRSGCRYGDDTAETTGSENFLTNTRCCVLPSVCVVCVYKCMTRSHARDPLQHK